MSDLTERLRKYADYRATADDMSRTMFEAADRIEALEAALRKIKAATDPDDPDNYGDGDTDSYGALDKLFSIARQSLTGEKQS